MISLEVEHPCLGVTQKLYLVLSSGTLRVPNTRKLGWKRHTPEALEAPEMNPTWKGQVLDKFHSEGLGALKLEGAMDHEGSRKALGPSRKLYGPESLEALPLAHQTFTAQTPTMPTCKPCHGIPSPMLRNPCPRTTVPFKLRFTVAGQMSSRSGVPEGKGRSH